MVGDNVRKYPELYRRLVDEGHRIGYPHPQPISADSVIQSMTTVTM